MARNIIIILSVFFLFNSCATKDNYNKILYSNQNIDFDAVSKKIIFVNLPNGPYTNQAKDKISTWLNKNIKLVGFNNQLEINVIKIDSNESLSDLKTRIDIEVVLEFNIIYSSLKQTKKITLKINQFEELEGSFSLRDKENIIDNLLNRIIDKLSFKLKMELI